MESQLVKGIHPGFKNNYLRLIASGHVEATALAVLEVDWLDFFEVCAKDPEFRANIEEARKHRADHWIDDIALSLTQKYETEIEVNGETIRTERPPSKDEIARDKLHFEKRKFLAQADNPEKYSPGAKPKINVEFDMTDFKLLSMEEAKKVLINDPFAKATVVEAEVVEEKK